ncbi:hypothetical protein M434DRAFT_95141 [Hypoxylon sp. CO27-5]|nr:hypothetical protein M434DRAFT_95141 [Hypoxylon sp. CO27-5]
MKNPLRGIFSSYVVFDMYLSLKSSGISPVIGPCMLTTSPAPVQIYSYEEPYLMAMSLLSPIHRSLTIDNWHFLDYVFHIST